MDVRYGKELRADGMGNGAVMSDSAFYKHMTPLHSSGIIRGGVAGIGAVYIRVQTREVTMVDS